jgi:hypothetical protein
MKSILLILGKETDEFARGGYNSGLLETAIETVDGHFGIMMTVIEDGYDVSQDINKFRRADAVIRQRFVAHLREVFCVGQGMARRPDYENDSRAVNRRPSTWNKTSSVSVRKP